MSARPSLSRRYLASWLYSGVLTLAIAAQLPTCVAMVQHSRFSSSEPVTAMIKSASSIPLPAVSCSWHHFLQYPLHHRYWIPGKSSPCFCRQLLCRALLAKLLNESTAYLAASDDDNSQSLGGNHSFFEHYFLRI